MRSSIVLVRMSSTVASRRGMSEKRTRVPPRGSSARRSRLTCFVANDAFAPSRRADCATGSATLSLTRASTEQSEFSPRS
ncbi:hypothetical protein PHK61_06070 [Actinomycetospora lutea]|uniref:hypothetical protein n=1 Tax=Actinomycetospora lutea TaxID=663604 RepID=UPI0023657D6F|nr:hypothetical protein [Actinomycetospora lutea]MDD7937982.1 hypothetical protein [Actinomycetospora lutea]